MMSIQLRLTSDQAYIIAKGCEVLSAIHRGHLVCLADIPTEVHEQRQDLADALGRLECYITGQQAGQYLSIENCSDEGKTAHDIGQIIRSHLENDLPEQPLISGVVAPSQLQSVSDSMLFVL